MTNPNRPQRARADLAVARRLRWYWPMEASNAAVVPAFAAGIVWSADGALTAAFGLAAFACAALLVLGALYWRAVLRRIEGDRAAMAVWIPRLAAAEAPALALVAVAALAWAAEMLAAGGGWTPARVAAAALTVLAGLEYVNYYRVQLQHFDNGADLKRLLTGRGFRTAQMARDIAAWRARGKR